jgi:hypothetical protein
MAAPQDPAEPLPWWAVAADVLVTIFFLIGSIALVTDGVDFHVAGVRVSARSATRPFMLALVIAAIRYYFVRTPLPVVRWMLRRQPPLLLDDDRIVAARPAGWRRRLRDLLLVTAGMSVFVAIASWPMVAQPYAVSDMGDPLFSIWRLMWIVHELPRHPLNLFNGNQMYPELRTLSFSDPTLAPTLLFAPLHALGVHRIVAYNIVFLAGWVFSGVTMFLFVRALTGRADAAWIAGAIFAAYPFRVEHLSHIELQMTIWMPIVLWCVHKTMITGRLRDGLATGAAVAAQFYSALYYGAFIMTYAFVVGAVLWLARGRPKAPLRALAAGAVLAAVLFSPVATVFLKTRSHMGNRHPGEVAFYSAVGTDYLKSHYRASTYHSLSEDAGPERSLFPRIVPVVLTLIALWPPLSATRVAYLLGLAFSVEMSLGMNGSVFPYLYQYVPPYGGIRVPARYSVMAGMSLAILSAYGAARVFRRWPQARGAVLAIVLAAIAYESVPNITLKEPWRFPPPIYGSLDPEHPVVIAEFPMPGEGTWEFAEFAYLYFSTFHWQTLVNGQSGWLPPSYIYNTTKARSFPSDQAVVQLRSLGVKYISIHGAFYSPEALPAVLEGAAARSDLELIATTTWNGSESRLYRLR